MSAVITSIEAWLALGLAAAAIGYLVYALLKPERF